MLPELSQAGATSNLLLHVKSPPRHDPTPIEKQEKQTALHRAGHRHAGPDAIVPLQRNPPSDGVEPPNLDLSLAASQSPSRKHNARGPRLARRWTPPLVATPKHRTRGPRHVRLSTPCHGSFYRIAVGKMNNVALFPRSPSNCRTAPRQSTTTRCTAHARSFRHHGSKPKLSLAPSSDDEPRRSNYSIAEPPSAIRCKPSCPTLSLPQVPQSDVVPCRTDNC